MLRFFYDTRYKYTNRTLIDVSGDTSYRDIDYANIDSPDTINGHIIYQLASGENIPTYIVDQETGRRYFVSGITPLSANKKFQISLLRDVLSEGNAWKEEESYVEAGLATNFNKYKRWNLPFTNTKIKEERLNFGGKSSFFVFYANEQHNNSNVITEDDYIVDITSVPGSTETNVIEVNNLNEIPGYTYVNAGDVHTFDYEEATAQFKVMKSASQPNTAISYVVSNIISQNIIDDYEGYPPSNYNRTLNIVGSRASDIANNTNSCKTKIGTALKNFSNSYKNDNYYPINYSSISSLIMGYCNKFIKYNGNIYKISYTRNSFNDYVVINKNDSSSLTVAIQNINIPTYPNGTSTYGVTGDSYVHLNYSGMVYNFTMQQIENASSFTFNFRADVPKLPKSAVRCVNIVSNENISNEAIETGLMLAQSNQFNLDNNVGQIIDIQYLPFSIADSVTLDGNNDPYIDFGVGKSPYTAFLDDDDFEFFTNMSDLTDINKETDTINIVSPSRGSQFLFRPYDNDGNMEFTTNVTIKPFASTIYVRPSTKGLLQYDWQDKDCLVINEDFSLTKVSSSWADYVRQNKNYQRIFDRNLQSKAYERSWERQVEKEQAKSDQYNATMLANQQGRNLTGNLPIISTVAGLFSQGISQMGGNNAYTRYMSAAQLDRQYNEALYQEGVALAQDQFNLQLENIKSQPLIPTNITTIDCKLLDGVYLEFYSTNPTEKKAIEDFYKYNGNRIDAFGRFSDYYGWYVKGKIIRSVNYTQPEVDEINRRLGIGIFTEVQYD